eukprot:185624-Rhodomonas_salina.2
MAMSLDPGEPEPGDEEAPNIHPPPPPPSPTAGPAPGPLGPEYGGRRRSSTRPWTKHRRSSSAGDIEFGGVWAQERKPDSSERGGGVQVGGQRQGYRHARQESQHYPLPGRARRSSSLGSIVIQDM